MNEEINYIVNEFAMYMNSNKFNCGNELDGYINISDVFIILNRIRDINLTN